MSNNAEIKSKFFMIKTKTTFFRTKTKTKTLLFVFNAPHDEDLGPEKYTGTIHADNFVCTRLDC